MSFLVDDGQQTPQRHATVDTAVGVDRGVTVAAVNSGQPAENPDKWDPLHSWREGRQPHAITTYTPNSFSGRGMSDTVDIGMVPNGDNFEA